LIDKTKSIVYMQELLYETIDPFSGYLKNKRGVAKRGAVLMTGKNIIEISDSTFDQEVLQAEVPVLVDFWAPWCGPCRAIAPVIEELSGDYAGKLKVAKCNVDDNPKTPSKYGIRAIPTLILFKNGSVSEQITGAVAKSQITAAIDKAVG
jgi:thioredoxin 1